ncbi:acetyl-CoA hydrolase/transferase C-terminal domain-containing protein [Aquamicrobium sp. LC103]|uniref:acetyl-CoA hydrolase/transferase family protein n=1 Tax=Aquamicrobium sp. LC103 TaxID=1120658 RepID=UPI00063E7973|nr:acetyl-CoA hydrolase/transferase C-terminal domain-containing protein [Aquamicrobium sp. LC103]TKT74800.1 acetyl-CoA hydrolase/transferase family protein [Aquamicrobium sp. LC103]
MSAISAAALDLPSLIREGDRVLVGQGTAEPLTLTRSLMRQAERLPSCSVFIGPTYSDTFTTEAPAHIAFESYGAIGAAAKLARAGRLSIYPEHFSDLAEEIGGPRLAVACVLIQLRPALAGGGYNLGVARDFVVEVVKKTRCVVAELNPALPACRGGDIELDLPFSAVVEAEFPPLEIPPPVLGETEKRIAANVAALVPDGAVLQAGVGSIPAAVLHALTSHKDLGFHSGASSDGLVALAEAGALTNARKEIDAGVSVTGILLGSRRLYEFAHRNPQLRLAGPDETHSLARIAGLSRFHAINSALEVDLTGQVGAELAGDRYVGAVGGQVDFVRAARKSPHGRAIVALPAATRDGMSRIVPQVGTVTCARSDADTIVTEHGVAELRGQSLDERARRMIAIAAPEWREPLARAWHDGRKHLQ